MKPAEGEIELMGSFVNEDMLQRFRGTGEPNGQGQTLEEFITAYDPKKYDCPSNTVDMVILRSKTPYRTPAQPLQILMIRRGNHPCIGSWALPGGFVELKEDLEAAARRELEEETGVTGLLLLQLRTWGAWDRDPRWRVITTAYLSLVEGDLPVRAGDDAADACWMDLALEMLPAEEAVTDSSAKEPIADSAASLRPVSDILSPGSSPAAGGPSGEEYRLRLTNAERGIALEAVLRREMLPHGILTEPRYTLLDAGGISTDHALIIADACFYLRKQAEIAGTEGKQF